MAMTTSTGKGPSAEMNVTPMIDVLLVLIIIFMIISPLAPRGEDAQIPQPDPHPQPEPPERVRTLVVQLLPGAGDHPRVAINRQEVPWDDLHDRLFDILKRRAEKVVFVMADKDVEFEPVAQVIDIVHQAGANKVGLMSEQGMTGR
ncbi:MAG TPA: biopolymer transporter ExbD [Terriglobales bacterium]|nr:biopolymer transporter ExbD [Terriglobales bacterium]